MAMEANSQNEQSAISNVIAFRPTRPALPTISCNDTVYVPRSAQIREYTTESARNLFLRQERRRSWHIGMLRVGYYRAALDMEHAIGCMHYWKGPEARHHPNYDKAARDEISRRHRRANAAPGFKIVRCRVEAETARPEPVQIFRAERGTRSAGYQRRYGISGCPSCEESQACLSRPAARLTRGRREASPLRLTGFKTHHEPTGLRFSDGAACRR